MSRVKIPYYTVKKGRGFWQPSPAMREKGFLPLTCGPDGPQAWARAAAQNAAWQAVRTGQATEAPPAWPQGSVGEGFERYRRTDEWASRALATREEWEHRAWPWIRDVFGDVDPRTIEMEDIEGLRATVAAAISEREAHRVIKIWRALWRVLAGFRMCEREADPSLSVSNHAAPGRSAIWSEREAARLVKTAWRKGYHGLAAVLAVMWDTAFSPVDVRTLTPSMQGEDAGHIHFRRPRSKTEAPAIGTLTHKSRRVLEAYMAGLGLTLPPESPIFRNRSGRAYSKDTMGDDFRVVREAAFKADTRKMMDFRRSASTEILAGGGSAEDISKKLANSIASSKALQQTYLPQQVSVVRGTDKARKAGREMLKGKNKTG